MDNKQNNEYVLWIKIAYFPLHCKPVKGSFSQAL